MGTRALDSMLVGLILISLIFVGSVILLIDIPIFNSVSQLSIVLAVLGLCLGLTFGLFAGRWYTKEQLRILAISNEFKGLGSRKILVALLSGMTLFLIFSSYVLYFKVTALAISLIYFVISATFTMYIARIKLISSWEKKEEKIIFADWKRIYALPNPPSPPQ
jgi:hypothetical protein